MKNKSFLILIILSVVFCVLSVFGHSVGIRMIFPVFEYERIFIPPSLPKGIISVNDADTTDIVRIPGIGENIASAILDEKDKHGTFYYPEDLLSVKGIGPSKLKTILPWITLD